MTSTSAALTSDVLFLALLHLQALPSKKLINSIWTLGAPSCWRELIQDDFDDIDRFFVCHMQTVECYVSSLINLGRILDMLG